ncbi:tetratricopeptide repeat protein [Parvularcula flava]|uniref:Tetratricopeptide repeat protein n=1 Tax=Aquisalinus luteolus TaxID=1566827 RepID=A0ABX0HHC9_9PROT|nr:tetratricopeptide repeat protein [Aquisalinus luteolus]NHK26624.1 tetratricopeptide repeat protein [Aquisalinus luteolus]
MRRRNVFRVAGVYAVVGWLIAQISSVLESSLSLPDWFDAVVVTLLLLGFPVAMLLAWAFEMTAEGMKPTKSVPADQSITAKTGQRLDYVIIAGLVLVIGLVGFQMIASPSGVSEQAGATAPGEASIAVLPFADMSATGDQEYFSDGIAEELLNVLAQVPDLQVAGRTSAFAFKGQNKDLREIGDILKVAHILEGSVRKAGDKVRITAQLIEVDSGYHLWSETYDRDMTDIFAVQDEISAAITAELVPRLTGNAPVQVARASDIDAYELYLLARQQEKGAITETFAQAAETLDRALGIDPDYVPALAWRSYYELMMSDAQGATGTTPFDKASATARPLIARAIELDPKSPDALFARAGLYLFEDNFAEAERFYRLALVQRPNFPYARNDLGYLYMRQGELEKAMEQFEIALEHDPALDDANNNVFAIYLGNGEFEKAKAALDRWSRISPDSPSLQFCYARYHVVTGNYAALVDMLEKDGDGPFTDRFSNFLPFIWATLGEYDKALDLASGPGRNTILLAMNRPEDAIRQARAYAEANPDGEDEYMFILHMTQGWDAIVDHYTEKYSSAEVFELSTAHPPYANYVPALIYTGHVDGEILLEYWADHVAGHMKEAPNNADNEYSLARIAVLRGEGSEEVMGHLNRAFELGNRNRGVSIEPIFRGFEDQASFNAYVDRVEAALNAERAKLDLPPKPLPRDIGG